MINRKFVRNQGTPSEDYLVYVVPNMDDEDSILERLRSHKHFLVNAIVVYPSDNHASSTGSRKYKARIVRNGRWIPIDSLEDDNAVGLINEYSLKYGFLIKKDSTDYDHIINEVIKLADISDSDGLYAYDEVIVPLDVSQRLIVEDMLKRAKKNGGEFKRLFDADMKETADFLEKIKAQTAAALEEDHHRWAGNADEALSFGNDIFGITEDEETKLEKKIENKKPNLSELDAEIVRAGNNNKSFAFFNNDKLPKNILEEYLLPGLNLKDDILTTDALAKLSRVTKSGLLFREYQDKTVHLIVDELLQAVVNGQYAEVKVILEMAKKKGEAKKIFPLLEKLLITPQEIVDYSGRHLYGTALQLALGAGDVSRPEFPGEGMVELIASFYDHLNYDGSSHGTSLKNEHYKEFFENSVLTEEENKKDMDVIETIFRRIINAKRKSDCEEELEVLRKYLEPNPEELITGKHFNYNMLIKAYELYLKYYDRLSSHDNFHKHRIVLEKVIGYLQRFLPANYAQICAQGHNGLNEPLKRLLEFRNVVDDFVLPPREKSGLGYHKVMTNGYLLGSNPPSIAVREDLEFFLNLCKLKTTALRAIQHKVMTKSAHAFIR